MAAPWRRDPDAVASQLRQMERRLSRVEAVLTQHNQSSAGPTAVVVNPAAPLFPPPAALPKALDRLCAVRQQCHSNGRQLQMVYDFIVSRYPNAIPDLERIMNQDPLSPHDSDDLALHPPSTDDDQSDGPDADHHDADADPSPAKRRRLNQEP